VSAPSWTRRDGAAVAEFVGGEQISVVLDHLARIAASISQRERLATKRADWGKSAPGGLWQSTVGHVLKPASCRVRVESRKAPFSDLSVLPRRCEEKTFFSLYSDYTVD
jgi:hypothetical protein